jgi:signal transduction histidine kinase/ActR/RegA family two-component response regulator
VARSHCHPEDLPRVDKAALAHLERRVPYDIEYRIRTKSGDYKWIHSRGQAVWNKDGVPIRFAGSHRDVTDRIEAEKRVSEFYSTVSHELRTPLTSIRGSLGLIEGGLSGEVSEKTMRFVQIARIECDRLIRLINEILDLRKIEAGKLELRLSHVRPEMVLKKVRQGMQGVADGAKVSLNLDVQLCDLLLADEDRVIQILTNLVSNAIKFSPEKSEVRIEATKRGNFCHFAVIDRGRGIPEDQMHRLFGKFQQVDSSDSRLKGGTGLGLAISKAIVEQHGGTIGVESTPDKGSLFWFEIPLVSVESAAKGVKTTIYGSNSVSRTSSEGRKQRVLIVEDDESSRTLLAHQLELMNLEVSKAATGASALNLVRAVQPDLLILDVGIPPPDGFEVIRILQSTEFATMPLIIYTSRDLTKDEKRQLVLGPTTHLVKSQTAINDLTQAVEKALPAIARR